MRWTGVFFTIGLILCASYYVVYRLIGILPNPILKVGLTIFAVGIVCCFPLSFFLRKQIPSKVTSGIFTVGLTWFISCIYLLILFIIFELIRIFGIFSNIDFFAESWTVFGILFLLISTLLVGGYFNYKKKLRVELNLKLNKETELKAPLKIVAVSDLHLGHRIRKKEFESWISLINKEKADIILFAGDLIDNDTKPLFEYDFASAFHTIQSKYGLYAILGNHEYVSGVSESIRFFQTANITLLRDTATLINDQCYIIGRDDLINPQRKSTEELVRNLDITKPMILMDHQPYNLEESEKNHIDLHLSGHTHYGQFWPVSWITNLIFEKAYGYLRKGNSHFYISSGMGIWSGKYRIGTRSEYVVINLK